MKILFVHQNYPGQFLRLAPALAARGHQVLAITDVVNTRNTPVETLRYKHGVPLPDPAATRLGRNFIQMSDRGMTVARAALNYRNKSGYVPDVIFGHSGWGETLFLKEVWPEAKLIVYSEFYYSGTGRDVGFDPEFPANGFDSVMFAQSRAAHLGTSLLHADAGLAPTQWQASTFPAALQPLIKVIFDGVDTALLRPNPTASLTLPSGQILRAGDEILSFVNRNLEPYRGYHSFMRALPAVMLARPQAQVVIVGGDEVSYGSKPKDGRSWKETYLAEVADRIDPARVHFLGKVAYSEFVSLMQITRAHAYLTYPFVLSWSMLEAMSAGAHVIGSRTPPVQELITDGVNGTLVDFFDIEGWSNALTEALANPDRAAPLRAAARETILKGYDLSTVCLPQMVAYVESFGPRG